MFGIGFSLQADTVILNNPLIILLGSNYWYVDFSNFVRYFGEFLSLCFQP